MVSIYASKFYKASNRKDGIRASLDNPINKELVLQLREYIDVPEKEVSETKPDKSNVSVQKPDISDKSESSKSEAPAQDRFSNAPRRPHVADHHLSNMLKEEESGEPNIEFKEETISKPSDTETESSENAEPVEESVDVSMESVNSSEDISTQTDSIMGLLNASDDTTGVRRCSVKSDNKELWIYYNDSINLNNVMEPVISLLNASDYSYLDFNRLARTDNAIVFSIAESQKPVEPVSE